MTSGKLGVLEAMKMLTTASDDSITSEVPVKKGEQVDSDDLLVRIETA